MRRSRSPNRGGLKSLLVRLPACTWRFATLTLITRTCARGDACGRRDVDDCIDNPRREIRKINRLACCGGESDSQQTSKADGENTRERASYCAACDSQNR